MFLAVKMMTMVPQLGCDPFLSTKCCEKSLLLCNFHILPTHPVWSLGHIFDTSASRVCLEIYIPVAPILPVQRLP